MAIDTDGELSYWESLRGYWRVYGPAQVFAMVFTWLYTGVNTGHIGALTAILLQALIGATAGFVLVPRIYSRPYRRIALVILDPAAGAKAGKKLGPAQLQHPRPAHSRSEIVSPCNDIIMINA